MLLELILGLIVVAIALYLLWKHLDIPVSFEKTIKNGRSVLRIKTNRQLKSARVIDKANNEKITLVRNNIEKGTSVEFVYPASQEEALVIIEDSKGEQRFKVTTNVG
ncbi:MAG: hypothetical protein HZA83_02245 [Thaumarchaeota archaeon]|nr:hypothetical protein [Nitrososphaerota archaeon]